MSTKTMNKDTIKEALLYGKEARPRSPLFDRALSELSKDTAVGEWIPIPKEERLPPYGEDVLVLLSRHQTSIWYIIKWRGDEHDIKQLIAWLPLPPKTLPAPPTV